MCGCALCPPSLLCVPISVHKSKFGPLECSNSYEDLSEVAFLAFKLLGRSVLFLILFCPFDG